MGFWWENNATRQREPRSSIKFNGKATGDHTPPHGSRAGEAGIVSVKKNAAGRSAATEKILITVAILRKVKGYPAENKRETHPLLKRRNRMDQKEKGF